MQKLQEKYSLQSLILNQVHLIHQVWQHINGIHCQDHKNQSNYFTAF